MSQVSSAIEQPSRDAAVARREDRLEILLREQRVIAWSLSIVTLVVTVVFFAMMTMAAPLLARVVLGRSVTLGTVVAVSIIVGYLVSIALFGLHCDRVDRARSEH